MWGFVILVFIPKNKASLNQVITVQLITHDNEDWLTSEQESGNLTSRNSSTQGHVPESANIDYGVAKLWVLLQIRL